MKKLITTIALLSAALSANSSFAETSGNYAEFDVIGNFANHKYANKDSAARNYSTFNDSSVGFGTSYKYAFNIKNIFLAPGVFFDKIGTTASDQDNDTVSIKNRYGAKFDVGYDISDSFAAYVTTGVSSTEYEVNWKSIGEKKSGSKIAALIGTGAIYHINDHITTNIEYNYQRVDASTPTSGTIREAKTDLHVAKIGVAFHF